MSVDACESRREDVERARAGDIVAFAVLRTQRRVIHFAMRTSCILERMEFPDRLSKLLLSLRRRADQEKDGLGALSVLQQKIRHSGFAVT